MGELMLKGDILIWCLKNGVIKELNLSDDDRERKWIKNDFKIKKRIADNGNRYRFRLF